MDKRFNRMLGSVAGGAAVRALDRYALAKVVKDDATKKYMGMAAGVGLGMLGTYGIRMLPGQLRGIAAGMAQGALGVVGAELMDMVTKQGNFGYAVKGYNFSYPTYNYGYYSAPATTVRSSAALEI